jgi:transposase
LSPSDFKEEEMAGSYSLDLRCRVIQDVDGGMSVADAAGKYSVTEPTIYSWIHLREETGSLKPREGEVGPKRKLDPHQEAILKVIDENSSVTLVQLHSQLQLPGNIQMLWNALQRWGISLKKSHPRRRATAA